MNMPRDRLPILQSGIQYVGVLVEIHSSERFDQYVRNNILDPLGVYASFNVNDLDTNRFATLYAFEEGQFIPFLRHTIRGLRKLTIMWKDFRLWVFHQWWQKINAPIWRVMPLSR